MLSEMSDASRSFRREQESLRVDYKYFAATRLVVYADLHCGWKQARIHNCPPLRSGFRPISICHPIFFFLLLALQIWNTFLHPFGRGPAFQKVIEEFLQAPRVVFLINPLAQAVLLAVIAEHIDLSVHPAQPEIELDALVPWHRVIFV